MLQIVFVTIEVKQKPTGSINKEIQTSKSLMNLKKKIEGLSQRNVSFKREETAH